MDPPRPIIEPPPGKVKRARSTAILGLLPLLVLDLHGSEVERPLALVMIGGLLTSTLFTLLALPTFYQWVHQRIGWLRSRREPAIPFGEDA